MAVFSFSVLIGYIGPGAGLGLVGALVSLMVSIGFAMAMVLVWPIRAAMRKRRTAVTVPTDEESPSTD